MMKFIGRSETISFLDLNINSIQSKIDTGAFGTSIHVDGLEIVDDKLHFWIGDLKNSFIFDKFKTVMVKNSFGEQQKRYSVFTKIKIGKSKYKILVSLSNRSSMRYPVLIGRRFLYKFGYVVDVTKKNIYDRDKKM